MYIFLYLKEADIIHAYYTGSLLRSFWSLKQLLYLLIMSYTLQLSTHQIILILQVKFKHMSLINIMNNKGLKTESLWKADIIS